MKFSKRYIRWATIFFAAVILSGCSNYSAVRTLGPPHSNPDDVIEFRSRTVISRTYIYYCLDRKYQSFEYVNKLIWNQPTGWELYNTYQSVGHCSR